MLPYSEAINNYLSVNSAYLLLHILKSVSAGRTGQPGSVKASAILRGHGGTEVEIIYRGEIGRLRPWLGLCSARVPRPEHGGSRCENELLLSSQIAKATSLTAAANF